MNSSHSEVEILNFASKFSFPCFLRPLYSSFFLMQPFRMSSFISVVQKVMVEMGNVESSKVCRWMCAKTCKLDCE